MFDYRQPVVLAGCVYYLVGGFKSVHPPDDLLGIFWDHLNAAAVDDTWYQPTPPNLKIVPLWDITLYHILSLILMKFQVCRWALFFARRHFCKPYFCICLLVAFPAFCFFSPEIRFFVD